MASTFQYGPIIRSEDISLVTASPKFELGTRTTFEGNDYIYVYNGSNSSLMVGYGVIVSAATNYTITLSSTASKMAGGIGVVKHSTFTTDGGTGTDNCYGFVMTRGFGKIATTDGLAIGDGFCLGADGVFENASGLTGPIVGKAMSLCASATATGPAYFNFCR